MIVPICGLIITRLVAPRCPECGYILDETEDGFYCPHCEVSYPYEYEDKDWLWIFKGLEER